MPETDTDLTALLRPGAVSVAGGLDVVDPLAVARLLVEPLAAQGLRADDETGETPYQARPGEAPRRLPRPALLDLLRRQAVDLLDRAAREHLDNGGTRSGAYRRLVDTAALLRDQDRGSRRYVWTLGRWVLSLVPVLTPAEISAAQVAAQASASLRRRESLTIYATPEERRRAETARRRAVRQETAQDTTEVVADLVARWVETLKAGRHLLPDVWAAWQAHAAATYPRRVAVRKFGRTRFYALLETLPGVEIRTGKARARFLVVPTAEARAYQDRIAAAERAAAATGGTVEIVHRRTA